MLALLTIHLNQRVPVDALMDAAWGDHVSSGALSTLESHIWRLRQLLEPDRNRRQAPSVLISDTGGYRLIGGPSTVDSVFFAESVAEVRDLLAAGYAASAVRRADASLALWRGQPYGALGEADWARAAVVRLEELRGQLQERRIGALLASGDVDSALTDVQPLIARMPFREPFRALHMEALHRSGRTEEALQAYQDARRTLLDEVGIEPGAELQDLHHRILRNDPTLTPVRRVSSAPVRNVEVHLPPSLTPLVGREDVVCQLSDIVRAERLVTLTGPAGCGKTRVAVEVARSTSRQFPDGVWFVDLTAVSDPDLVVDVIVSTIGLSASSAAPLRDLNHYLQTRRALLVLDNCEHVLAGVDEVVQVTLGDPGVDAECCFLTTSREPLGIGGETIWTLDPLDLPGENQPDSSAASAVTLFLQRLRAVAPTLSLDDRAMATVVSICVAVDGLPLPLELAAARVHSYTLDEIATQVAADPSRLSRLGHGPDDHRTTLRSAIEWSYQLLTPQEQRVHRRLSVLPGPFTPTLAAAVVGDLDHADVDELLARLVHRSMLNTDGVLGRGRLTRFRQLATVRGHARHVLVKVDEPIACADRRDAWTAELLSARPLLGTAAEADWYRSIDDNYATVRATLARHLIEQPDELGGRIAGRLYYYWYYRQMMVEASRWLRLGHDVLTGGDSVDLVVGAISLASALAMEGRADLARPHVEHVLGTLPETGTDRLVEIGEGLVGLAFALFWRDEFELVIEVHRQLTHIAALSRSAHLALLADAVGSEVLFSCGQVQKSIRQAESVRLRAAAANNPMAGWLACGPPSIAALIDEQPVEGIRWWDRCVQDHLRLGVGGSGMFIETRANYVAMLGDHLSATRLYASARAETRRSGMPWPRRALTQQLLTATRDYLSRPDFEQAWQDGERLTIFDIVKMNTGQQLLPGQPSAH